MPNDEVFVASQLCNNNFKYENLASKNFGSFNTIDKYYNNINQEQIHHPVHFSYDDIFKKLYHKLQNSRLKNVNDYLNFSLEILKSNNFDPRIYEYIIKHKFLYSMLQNELKND